VRHLCANLSFRFYTENFCFAADSAAGKERTVIDAAPGKNKALFFDFPEFRSAFKYYLAE
jgi:hypothetical protein